jgi:hypothetical protein
VLLKKEPKLPTIERQPSYGHLLLRLGGVTRKPKLQISKNAKPCQGGREGGEGALGTSGRGEAPVTISLGAGSCSGRPGWSYEVAHKGIKSLHDQGFDTHLTLSA